MLENNSTFILYEHIIKYANLTDEEVYKIGSTEYEIDAEKTLTTFVERDLCKTILNNLLNDRK